MGVNFLIMVHDRSGTNFLRIILHRHSNIYVISLEMVYKPSKISSFIIIYVFKRNKLKKEADIDINKQMKITKRIEKNFLKSKVAK